MVDMVLAIAVVALSLYIAVKHHKDRSNVDLATFEDDHW